MNVPSMVAVAADLRLETERLVLRRLEQADRDTAIEHELDPRIMHHIRDPLPEEQVRARIAAMFGEWSGADGEWLGLAVTLRGEDRMFGLVACRVESAARETVEFGYRLHPDQQGRGYATEASRVLLDWLLGDCAVRKVTAMCVADNSASFRVMEKLGMRREAQLREWSQLRGEWRDELVYGLLAREWSPSTGPFRHRSR